MHINSIVRDFFSCCLIKPKKIMLSSVLVAGLLLSSSFVSARPAGPLAPQVSLFNISAAVTPPGQTTLTLVYQGYGKILPPPDLFQKLTTQALRITPVTQRREHTSRAVPQKPNSWT